jgi:hypothetical protein
MTKLWKPSLCALALAFGLGATACLGGGVRAEYGVTATYSEPSLAYVGNGIWVVDNSSYPVFYDSGSYWAYRDGVWLRSRYYGRGYVNVGYDYVPYRVRRVYRPNVYVHYRARPGVRVRVGGPRGRVIVRGNGRYRNDRRVSRRDNPRYYRDRDRRWRD